MTNIMQDESVSFTDESINSPTSWSWSFGDGATSTKKNPTHTYATPEVYTVGLTVSNNSGSDSEVKTDYITVIEGVVDVDGNVYDVVTIGEQTWMAENLKVTRYSDGSAIPYVVNDSEWEPLGSSDKAYCWYDNSTTNRDTYGGLYSWAAAMNGAVSSNTNPSGVQGVCPNGWHLPSDNEWKELEMFLGLSQSEADATGWRGTDEGGKIKEPDTEHWHTPNTGATNESGFTALPAGFRYSQGPFGNLSYSAHFITATENDAEASWNHSLSHTLASIERWTAWKDSGNSVRCIKD